MNKNHPFKRPANDASTNQVASFPVKPAAHPFNSGETRHTGQIFSPMNSASRSSLEYLRAMAECEAALRENRQKPDSGTRLSFDLDTRFAPILFLTVLVLSGILWSGFRITDSALNMIQQQGNAITQAMED